MATAAAVGLVALGDEPRRESEPAPPAVDAGQGATRKVERVTPEHVAVVAALGRAQTVADKVPLAIGRQFADGGEHGVNMEFARRAERRGPSVVWVAPASRGICLVSTDPRGMRGGFSVDCRSLREVALGRLYSTWVLGADPRSGQVTVFGVVPNGVRAVTVTDDDGSTRLVPVRSNVFAVRGGHARWVEFDTPAGHQRTRV
ncbi:MAG TPA: hypothetical protein VF520_12945 [Thermoleophilaceae bacterium]